ncbi:hypothetical protein CLAIMM_11092 [Cladophialophora immunda]|nr:hypothetical protein CLAIMM_11092 [Cladophialophora immunda]
MSARVTSSEAHVVTETTQLLGSPVADVNQVKPNMKTPSVTMNKVLGDDGSIDVAPTFPGQLADIPADFQKKLPLLLPALAIGVFLCAIDQLLIVATYPKIGSDLKALNSTGWIATAYFLTLTSFQPLYGKLSDIFGPQSMPQLVGARAIAGIGGGGMSSVVSIIVSDFVPLRERGIWQGYLNLIFAAGTSTGSPLGGFLVNSVGWRWSFLGQIPLCILAFLVVYIVLDVPAVNSDRWAQKLRCVDFVGALTLIAAVCCLLIGLDNGSNEGWNKLHTILPVSASPVLFALFMLVESKYAAHPFAPGHIIFDRSLFACYACNFFSTAGYMAALFLLPLLYQAVYELSPVQAGMLLIPGSVSAVLGSLGSGLIIKRTGHYYKAAITCYCLCLLCPVVFVTALAWKPQYMAASMVGTIIGQILVSIGQGAGTTTTLVGLLANTPKEEMAVVTACSYLFRSLGSSFGISILSAVFQQSLKTRLLDSFGDSNQAGDLERRVRESLEYINQLEPQLAETVLNCYSLVSYLEDSVARLEQALGISQNDVSAHHSCEVDVIPEAASSPAGTVEEHVLKASGKCMMYACRQALRHETGLVYQDVLLAESELPKPTLQSDGNDDDPFYVCTSSRGLNTIPRAVAEMLLNVYVEKILPYHPIFLERDLRQIYHRVYSGRVQDDHEVFVILMIFAISTMSSRFEDLRKPMSLADSLRQEATNHFNCTTSSIPSLQSLLLTAQLAYVLPHIGKLEHLVAEAMRMAVELGLHTEHPEMQMDAESSDFRRRIFWQVYAMERSVNASTRRPFVIADEHINVALPSVYEHTVTRERHMTRKSRVQFVNAIHHRKLQSEISSKQFYRPVTSQADYQEWMTRTAGRILSLRRNALSEEELAPDWFDYGPWYNMLILHRPCPANPAPDLVSIKYCITAAAHLVSAYCHTARHGLLKFPFHGLHNCFEAGIILLYNIMSHPKVFSSTHNVEFQQTLEVLGLISDVFPIICELWPKAKHTTDLFESLQARVLRAHSTGSFERSDPDLLGMLRNIIFLEDNLARSAPVEKEQSQTSSQTDIQTFVRKPSHMQEEDELTNSWFELTPDVFNSFGSWGFQGQPHTLTAGELPNSFSQEHLRLLSPDSPASLQNPVSTPERVRGCKQCRIIDPLLSKEIPRPYLFALKQRLDELLGKISHNAASESFNPSLVGTEAVPTANISEHESRGFLISFGKLGGDHAADTTFLGSSSPIYHLKTALEDVSTQETNHDESIEDYDELNDIETASSTQGLPTGRTAKKLVETYRNSIERLFPVLGDQTMASMLAIAQNIEHAPPTGDERILVLLILAISTRLRSKRDSRLAGISAAYLRTAMADSDAFRRLSQQPGETGLRLTLLLSLYLLLDPLAGNVWRLLGYACRLCTDLRWELSSPLRSQQIDWTLYCTVFRLECEVAIAYGRPSQLRKLDFVPAII